MKKDEKIGVGMRPLPLLLVLGGVAILSAVGYFLVLPGYRDLQAQNKLAEVFVSLDACRAQINQLVQSTTAPALTPGLLACDGGASVGVKISPHLKSIAVSPVGAITVTLDYRSLPELTPTTSTLTLVPLSAANTVLRASDVHMPIFAWRCGSPQDGTTIPSQYLPSSCRG